MDKLSFFLLNIFLNSFLVFFTAVFLVEGILFLFMIPQGRVAAFLRALPILKLPLDLVLYDFSRWAYLQGINPFQCEEGTRSLSINCGFNDGILFSNIEFTLPGLLTFTPADLVGYLIPSFLLKVFSVVLIGITLFIFLKRVFYYRYSVNTLRILSREAKPVFRKVHNTSLLALLKKSCVRVATSRHIVGSPFVAGLASFTIYIPESLLKNLSQSEYEAVLAHELEHITYKDSLLRLILDVIAHIFWWVPTQWLFRRIEEGLEMECDRKCCDPLAMASALCKSAKHSLSHAPRLFCHYLSEAPIFKRVKGLTHPQKASTRFRSLFYFVAFALAFFTILISRLWLF